MGINEIIRNRRIERGLSMKELAERLGVSEGTIPMLKTENTA